MKPNIIHPSCSQERFQAQNDKNDWFIDEKNEPVRIYNFAEFEKRSLKEPSVVDIPDFKTKRPVDWIKVAKEEPFKDVLVDGGEAALLDPVKGKEDVAAVVDGEALSR